ncbi:MAG: EamA family transporter, partial [Pararhizobium sp.]
MTDIPAVAPHAETQRGLMMATVGGLALTVDVPLIRLANGDVWSILAVRSCGTFAVALLCYLVYRLATGRRLTLVPGRAGLAVVGLYALSAITFMTAVFHTTTANLVFILAFNTAFSVFLSWAFLKERPAPQTLLAIAAMILGVV